MIPVEDARRRILSAFRAVGVEQIALADAFGRVLAEDVVARVTQPPVAVSAMDGYAVRHDDVATVPVRLNVIGEAPAGRAFAGQVETGQAVRIFTGGPVPVGADAIVIQEDTERDGDFVTVLQSATVGRFIRPAGLDFNVGETGLSAGRVLTSRDIGLAAAMNVPWLKVRRRPRVAVLSTGDELVNPGEPVGPSQIICSNGLSLAAFVRSAGGEPIELGIAPDDIDALASLAAGARGADILVTSGGASVGEHDLIQTALGRDGLKVDFWKVAMRPGKPLIFGHYGETPFLGLPGNPVSSLVCAVVFLGPILDALLGLERRDTAAPTAKLGADLGDNDRRQDYLRATLGRAEDGDLIATPFAKQDSSMLSRLAWADCLIVRPPHAPAARAGERVEIIPLGGSAGVV